MPPVSVSRALSLCMTSGLLHTANISYIITSFSVTRLCTVVVLALVLDCRLQDTLYSSVRALFPFRTPKGVSGVDALILRFISILLSRIWCGFRRRLMAYGLYRLSLQDLEVCSGRRLIYRLRVRTVFLCTTTKCVLGVYLSISIQLWMSYYYYSVIFSGAFGRARWRTAFKNRSFRKRKWFLFY